MHWLIQENLISNQGAYIKALSDLGVAYTLVTYNNESLSEYPKDVPVWFFGSTGMVKFLSVNKKNVKVIYNPDNFSFKSLLKNYQDQCLNFNCQIIPIKEIPYLNSGHYFIRPNSGLKLFAGGVYSKEALLEFHQDVSAGKYSFTLDELVVIGKRRLLEEEYRLFVVGGVVVTGCQYMHRGQLTLNEVVPGGVIEFAQGLISQWTPESCFVLDICRVFGGYKVLEINCIHSSGPYVADMTKVVLAVNKLFK